VCVGGVGILVGSGVFLRVKHPTVRSLTNNPPAPYALLLIHTAYRRTCLESHPDKKLIGVDDPAEKQRIEDAFKTIQEAYEVLSDPAKRREYDSTDEFDDTLPTGCDPADFFKVGGWGVGCLGLWD